MSPGPETIATPGEVLRNWQRGACDWLQVLSRTAQQLHSASISESARFVEHLQKQHARRHANTAKHAAFASLSASLPAARPNQKSRGTVRFSGKGINCIISDLADSATLSIPHKGHAVTDSSKPNSEELQERILVSEVVLILRLPHMYLNTETTTIILPAVLSCLSLTTLTTG